MSPTFDAFFQAATGHPPYDYQCRLACGPDARADRPDTLTGGITCQSQLINIPTGLGKTAAVVLAWLWNVLRCAQNEAAAQQPGWPRRLVYCLPMRTLVEQTRDNAQLWILRLALAATEDGSSERALLDAETACLADLIRSEHEKKQWLALARAPWIKAGRQVPIEASLAGELTHARGNLIWLATHSPVILMGGEELDEARREWDIHPERPAILIGTQDMLLSRALNRGYGMSRARWPMHFGLLNNDCLWVMDETQLMGPGLSTACQLEAFRNSPTQGLSSFGAAGSVTWYMSATNNPDVLRTREWRTTTRPGRFIFGLTDNEKSATNGPIHERRSAVKRLELRTDLNFGDTIPAKTLVEHILAEHQKMLTAISDGGSLPARTLIICNTVDRAVAAYQQLLARKPDGSDLLLLHSRFRPPERKEQVKRLGSVDRTAFPKGQFIIATQVIEAGVDISSGILFSEVAPLASLVQRLGRLNRSGEFNQSNWKPLAFVAGVGLQPESAGKNEKARQEIRDRNVKCCLPYQAAACESASSSLQKLNGNASPASLEQIHADIAASIKCCPYSLQRHELLDFFDTDANLSLGFTDVSPFVRGLDDDTDLQVLWRENWLQRDGDEGTGEPGFSPDFQRDELCPVPIGKAKAARDILAKGWLWRGKEFPKRSTFQPGSARLQ